MPVIDLQAQFLAAQAEPWQEVLVARVDQYAWMMIQALGEYPWHVHEERDDCFLVLDGCLGVETQMEGVLYVRAGQMLVVPRGVRHRTFSKRGARVLLFEPMGGIAP